VIPTDTDPIKSRRIRWARPLESSPRCSPHDIHVAMIWMSTYMQMHHKHFSIVNSCIQQLIWTYIIFTYVIITTSQFIYLFKIIWNHVHKFSIIMQTHIPNWAHKLQHIFRQPTHNFASKSNYTCIQVSGISGLYEIVRECPHLSKLPTRSLTLRGHDISLDEFSYPVQTSSFLKYIT